MRILQFAAVGMLSIGLLFGSSVWAAEPVTVDLKSGRSFTATVDAKTDARQLWLRFDVATTEIRRPIDWSEIAGGRVAGRSVTTEELRTLVGELQSSPPRMRAIQARSAVIPSNEGLKAVHVRSLQIDAAVANWDSDVEVDGILLTVYPLDAQGQLVRARGTLEVDLVGEGRGPALVREDFPQLGRWVRQMNEADFGAGSVPSPAVYRLEFQAVHPEFQLNVGPYGLVHARLSVPGQGTYEASAGATLLRPFSPLRESLQEKQHQRFLPTEQTGRGKRMD